MSRETLATPPDQTDAPEGDALAAELAALRDVAPPASLVARVMTQVAAPQPFSLWRWLRRPIRFEVRLSALSVLALGVVLAGGATALVRAARHSPDATIAAHGNTAMPTVALPEQKGAASDHAGEPVLVRFVFEGHGAHRVAVAGSFNAWREQALQLEDGRADTGIFVAMLALPRGTHEYMFVVDGRWVADPMATELRPDGFGRQNSLLRL